MFSFFIFQCFSLWETYFGNIDYPDEYAYSPKPIQINQPGDYYIYDCVYTKVMAPISFNVNEKTRLLVESCTFNRCYSPQSGAAILFKSFTQVSLFVYRTCGYKCHLKDKNYDTIGNFALVIMDSAVRNIVNFTLTSISQCPPKDYSGFNSVVCSRGKQKFNTFNSTQHTSLSSPGLQLDYAPIGIVKYSTFNNNSVNIYGVVTCDSGNYTLDTVNFIGNIATTSSGASVLCSKGIINAKKCAFLENRIKTILSVTKGQILFITDSYLQDGQISGSVTTSKLKVEAATNSILHYATYLCPTHQFKDPRAFKDNSKDTSDFDRSEDSSDS